MPVPFRTKLAADAAAYAAQNPKLVIACNNSSWDDSASLIDIIRTEVIQIPGSSTNGYAPASITVTAGSFDATQNRHESGPYNISLTGANGGFSFDRLVCLSQANASFRNRAVQTIDASANRLRFDTATALGLANGNRVIVTADVGGVVPTELVTTSTALFIVNILDTASDRSLQLSLTSGGAAIDFSAGSGTIRMRSVDGTLDYFDIIGSTSVATAQTKTYPIAINWGNGNADINAA